MKKRPVTYYPPAHEVIEEYAEKVCQQCGIQQAEVAHELGNFVKLVANITSKHFNQQTRELLDGERK